MKNKFIGMTLIELLVGLVLLSIIVLGLSQIDLFSRAQVLRTDRQAVLQNELSLILNHMDKTGMRVIGNERIVNDSVVVYSVTGNEFRLSFYVDGNSNGRWELPPGPGALALNVDHWISYHVVTSGGTPYRFEYCDLCLNAGCNPCSGTSEILGTHIRVFNVTKNGGVQLSDNYVNINDLTACWDSDGNPDLCGTSLNPQVTMHTVINFPMVSTN